MSRGAQGRRKEGRLIVTEYQHTSRFLLEAHTHTLSCSLTWAVAVESQLLAPHSLFLFAFPLSGPLESRSAFPRVSFPGCQPGIKAPGCQDLLAGTDSRLQVRNGADSQLEPLGQTWRKGTGGGEGGEGGEDLAQGSLLLVGPLGRWLGWRHSLTGGWGPGPCPGSLLTHTSS